MSTYLSVSLGRTGGTGTRLWGERVAKFGAVSLGKTLLPSGCSNSCSQARGTSFAPGPGMGLVVRVQSLPALPVVPLHLVAGYQHSSGEYPWLPQYLVIEGCSVTGYPPLGAQELRGVQALLGRSCTLPLTLGKLSLICLSWQRCLGLAIHAPSFPHPLDVLLFVATDDNHALYLDGTAPWPAVL